ncbi:AraC family transcriptional regulator [Streptomyces sp. NPDC002225]|uniref:AraC family transcriptional regulator n=1 Tax=Streptomyces sp. NPDC002225 TaxID=3154413 RepID=UPI003327970B
MPMTTETAGSDGLYGVDCFEHWREVLGRSRVAEMTSDHVTNFEATVRQARLGPAVVTGTAFPSILVRRTVRMIRQCDEELYHLTMLTAGCGAVASSGSERTETLTPGYFHLATSSQPYESRFSGTPSTGTAHPRTEGIGIDLPVSLLAVPPRRVRHLLGRVLPGQQGTGAILATFLLGLERQLPALGPVEATRLGTVAVDLVSACVARELDAEDTLPEEIRRRTMLHDVRVFVRHHLHDPDLTPSKIAAAHHVSLSYLHRLFTRDSHGTTLAAYVRHQRLAKAYQDLIDPALRNLPIHAVAVRCGITHASAFTRAFKAAYGMSPSDHRHGFPADSQLEDGTYAAGSLDHS